MSRLLSKKDYQFEQLSPDAIDAGIGVQRQSGVPPITATIHTLLFDRLSPRDFERLCLWLVEREGYGRAEHLGAVVAAIS
jgi:hypothetical protein